MSKRNYRNNIEFVEAGFTACWHNSQDLVKGAKLLLDNSLHAQALSLSVLALEELGKLFCIDGILFAHATDHKAQTFAKSLKSHSTKLSALELFPLLLDKIASLDPRYKTDARFKQTMAISFSNLNERGNQVTSMLKSGTFDELDKWKQYGFYSQSKNDTFIKPNDAVEPEVAEAVYMLAWRASSSLDFLLKQGNLDRYMAFARELRSKLSESDHQEIEQVSKRMLDDLFPDEMDESVKPIQPV